MKILIVSTFYYPNMQGGVEQVIKRLAENYVLKGHDVAIYCGDSKLDTMKIETINGVTVYRASTHGFNLYKFSYDKKMVGKVEKIKQKLLCYFNKKNKVDFEYICDSFKPDIIHTNTLYGLTPEIWKWSFKLKVPVIHTIHDISPVSPTQFGHSANYIVKKSHKLYMNYYSKYVSAVTAPSKYTLTTSIEAGNFKNAKLKFIIENAIEVNEKKIESIIKKKSNSNRMNTKFIFVGRLVYFKGIKSLIEAFISLKNNDELHICGDGELKDFVQSKSLNYKNIIYHGKLNHHELYNLIQLCDVMVVPSEWPEPFGMVVIEGNVNGIPVIGSNTGGIPEILNVTKGGELYNYEEKNQLFILMKQFSEMKDYSKYQNNILNNIGHYSLDIQINRFLELYENFEKKGKN